MGITSKVLEHNSIGFKNFGGTISKVSEKFTYVHTVGQGFGQLFGLLIGHFGDGRSTL